MCLLFKCNVSHSYTLSWFCSLFTELLHHSLIKGSHFQQLWNLLLSVINQAQDTRRLICASLEGFFLFNIMDWFSKSNFGNGFRNTEKNNWQHAMKLYGSSHCWNQRDFCLLLPLKVAPRISFFRVFCGIRSCLYREMKKPTFLCGNISW